MVQRILRRPQVLERTGDSRSTLYAKMAAGIFPRPVRIGPRAVGWVESEIDEYVMALIAERDAGECEAGASPESDAQKQRT